MNMRIGVRSALEPEAVAAVHAAASDRLDEVWVLLERLVGIDTGAGQIAGMHKAVALMQEAWESIGCSTNVRATPSGAPVLEASRVVDSHAPMVVLLCHLDTVFPPGTAAARPFAVDGNHAFGPGVADAKGAAAAAWLAVAAAISATGLRTINVRVLANADEESGSVGSRQMIEEAGQQAALVLVFEPARPDGSIVTARRGARRYRIRVDGKAAHTGVEPWLGVNAIEAAAHKVIALQGLNDRAADIAVTVATIAGGQAINIVPADAQFEVDTRFPSSEHEARLDAAVNEISGRDEVAGSRASVETISWRPAMSPHPLVPAIVDRYLETASALGLELQATSTGGASDGCFTSALGIPTVDGLGPVGGGYHSPEEFLVAETLLQRAALTGAVLTTL
jgi:glutamate carboxypeptidase